MELIKEQCSINLGYKSVVDQMVAAGMAQYGNDSIHLLTEDMNSKGEFKFNE